MSVTLSKQATYGALKRKVTLLRQRVSDYDAETAKLKQRAEREGGPAARFVVDSARSPKFHDIREKLRQAEADFAAWKFPAKARKPNLPFSSMIKLAMGRER